MDRCKWRKMIKDVRSSGWVLVGECFFWYRPTRVVPDKRPLNGCVCVCLILLVGQEKENRCLYTRSFFTRTGGLRTKGSGQAPGLGWSLIFVITPSDYCYKVCKNVCLQAGCHSSSLRVAEEELGVNGVLSYEA